MKDLLKQKSPEFTESQYEQIKGLLIGLVEDGYSPEIISHSPHHVNFIYGDAESGKIEMILINNNGELLAHQK